MTIVTSHYRYKRPPRKRRLAVPLEGPAIVTIRDKKRVTKADPGSGAAIVRGAISGIIGAPIEEAPATDPRKSAIVTIRRKPKRVLPSGLLPETPEEHKRRSAGADAMFR
jgi:hypothetical protein